jgi:triosephosphate isomerase
MRIEGTPVKPLIAGNWKMNGLMSSLAEIDRLAELFEGKAPSSPEIVVCPPATLVASMSSRAARYGFLVGAQDCHERQSGAFTGEVSAEMLKDAGAEFVIVGHSERRIGRGETDAAVKAKAEAARRAGLIPIFCVGETDAERKAKQHLEVVARQLSGSLPAGQGALAIAYEPAWAIGAGVTPTAAEIAEMHAFIREQIGAAPRILYGGSVKPANAAEILALPEVGGALVGGASLKADEFHAIIKAA